MGIREVHVFFEIREVLWLWVRGEGLRSIERLAVVDRKTVQLPIRDYGALRSSWNAGYRTGLACRLSSILLSAIWRSITVVAEIGGRELKALGSFENERFSGGGATSPGYRRSFGPSGSRPGIAGDDGVGEAHVSL
jgi:hypothetical protein